uniref:Uncharacterized protein n=1 Tax=Megaselia scalaris TaxID=36166 RepID=T1GVH1_MEGSC
MRMEPISEMLGSIERYNSDHLPILQDRCFGKVTGIFDSIRNYVSHVVGITYQTIDKDLLKRSWEELMTKLSTPGLRRTTGRFQEKLFLLLHKTLRSKSRILQRRLNSTTCKPLWLNVFKINRERGNI